MALRNSSPEARSAFRPSEVILSSALILAALLVATSLLTGCNSHNSPAASRQPVASEYHGQPVTEDYQWLEAGTNPAVRQWTAAQNARAREFLDRTESRPLVEARLRELFSKTSPNYSAFHWSAGWLFYLEFKPPAQQPVLKVLKAVTGTNDPDHGEIVLDPNQLSTDGSSSIDWFVPSPDGKRVAVSLSEKGTERGTLYFFETATGKTARRRAGVNGATAGGSAVWNGDSSGVFYTRSRRGERPEADLSFYQQVYFHQLGTASERDRYEVGKSFRASRRLNWRPAPITDGWSRP
jgi:prolyl oligopeptidase